MTLKKPKELSMKTPLPPFCPSASPANGFSNAKYRETGDLRDQWLCDCHGLPSRTIFMGTERWKPERDAWLGKTQVPETGDVTGWSESEIDASLHRLTSPDYPALLFPPPITGAMADEVFAYADVIRDRRPDRSQSECLSLAVAVCQIVNEWHGVS
jgi:hypothetical protein